jgi:hypothetical protein
MEEWDRGRAEREIMEQLEDETWEEAAERVFRRR